MSWDLSYCGPRGCRRYDYAQGKMNRVLGSLQSTITHPTWRPVAKLQICYIWTAKTKYKDRKPCRSCKIGGREIYLKDFKEMHPRDSLGNMLPKHVITKRNSPHYRITLEQTSECLLPMEDANNLQSKQRRTQVRYFMHLAHRTVRRQSAEPERLHASFIFR